MCDAWRSCRPQGNAARYMAHRQPPSCREVLAERKKARPLAIQIDFHCQKTPSLCRTAPSQHVQYYTGLRQRLARRARSTSNQARMWRDQWSYRRDVLAQKRPFCRTRTSSGDSNRLRITAICPLLIRASMRGEVKLSPRTPAGASRIWQNNSAGKRIASRKRDRAGKTTQRKLRSRERVAD